MYAGMIGDLAAPEFMHQRIIIRNHDMCLARNSELRKRGVLCLTICLSHPCRNRCAPTQGRFNPKLTTPAFEGVPSMVETQSSSVCFSKGRPTLTKSSQSLWRDSRT